MMHVHLSPEGDHDLKYENGGGTSELLRRLEEAWMRVRGHSPSAHCAEEKEGAGTQMCQVKAAEES
jgi:hypothetical protein